MLEDKKRDVTSKKRINTDIFRNKKKLSNTLKKLVKYEYSITTYQIKNFLLPLVESLENKVITLNKMLENESVEKKTQEINPFSMGEIERIHNLMENIPDKDGPNGDSMDLRIWHRDAIKHYEKTKAKVINAKEAFMEACKNPYQCGVIEPNDTDCAQCEWYPVWKALRD